VDEVWADIAAIFGWEPSAIDKMESFEELLSWWDKAIKRAPNSEPD